MKFYKILSEDNIHHGFEYKTGLNVDHMPFNPSGNCLPGGLYYSREDILHFLEFGKYIAEVTIPEDAQVYENPGFPQKWKADKIILGEREEITSEVLIRLVGEGAETTNDNWFILSKLTSITTASGDGLLDFVKFLFDGGWRWQAGNTQIGYAYCSASSARRFEIVEYFLDRIPHRITAEFSDNVLSHAVYNNHIEMLRLILEKDPNIKDLKLNRYCRAAILRGYNEILELLLAYFEQSSSEIEACFNTALFNDVKHLKTVELLLDYTLNNFPKLLPSILLYNLQRICYLGELTIAELLLKYGATLPEDIEPESFPAHIKAFVVNQLEKQKGESK